MQKSPLNYVLWLLSRREYSTSDIKKKLVQKEVEENKITEIIELLQKQNLLSDRRFAENLINRQKNRYGKQRMKFTLATHGIDEDLTKSLLDKVNEEFEDEAAQELAIKWMKNKEKSDKTLYNKLGGFLTRKGFSYPTVKKVLNQTLK